MLILYGASGHGKVILDIFKANGLKPDAIWDDAPKGLFCGYTVSPPQLDDKKDKSVVISIGDNNTRKMIAGRIETSCNFLTAVHPRAVLAESSSVGPGTVVMANAVINADSKIGKHVIINTGAVVEHDCLVADFVHISPNATLCGNVSVGEGTHIGAGVVVIPGINIGSWCKIGAGAVVIRDVPDGSTVVGNPGRIIKG